MSKELIDIITEAQWNVAEYIPKIKKLIKDGADVNYKDKNKTYENWTPLHHCVVVGGFFTDYLEIAKVLLEYGATVNNPNNDGLTPTLSSIKHFSLDIFEFLMKNGGNIDNVTVIYQNLIEQYCYEKELDEEHNEDTALSRLYERIDVLIKNGFNINGDVKIEKYFALAINKGIIPVEILDYLFDKGADAYGEKDERPLYHALFFKFPKKTILKIISIIGLEYKFEEHNNITPIEFATAVGNLKVIKKLVKLGAKRQEQALVLAEKKDMKEIVKFLKKAIANKM